LVDLPNFVQNLRDRVARDAGNLYRELVRTLLPYPDHHQSLFLDVALTHINVYPNSDQGNPMGGGYSIYAFRNPDAPNATSYDRESHVQIDPRDYDRHTFYNPRENDHVGRAFLDQPNVHRVMGPLFLLLHEREQNTGDLHDTPAERASVVPGPPERRPNALRRALGLPQRTAYNSYIIFRGENRGRRRTRFEHGWVYHPDFF
jgi:hypothetical protein